MLLSMKLLHYYYYTCVIVGREDNVLISCSCLKLNHARLQGESFCYRHPRYNSDWIQFWKKPSLFSLFMFRGRVIFGPIFFLFFWSQWLITWDLSPTHAWKLSKPLQNYDKNNIWEKINKMWFWPIFPHFCHYRDHQYHWGTDPSLFQDHQCRWYNHILCSHQLL